VSEIERKLAAIFAADVEGYSRLMGLDEVGTLRTLTAYRAIIDGLIAQHRGRVFNSAGDSVLAEFPSVVDAVQCAVEVQRSLTEKNLDRSPEQQMRFRIGVHVGDVIVKGDDLFGDGVNIAARLETLAEPGGICVSGSVRDYVGKKLPVVFTDCGEQAVKNIAEPVRVYRVGASAAAPIDAPKRASLPLPDKPSIAVLPFTNMSGDPEQDYFADGIVEDIITALSRFQWLFVIARNSSFTYKGRPVEIKQVGRELGVRYVLEGSIRKASTKVRITGQLIDATNGAHLWADRFDGLLEDIFDLQDRITSSVVGAIEPRLLSAETERARRKPTENLGAYDCFLRAMPLVFGFTKEGSEEALSLLKRAINLDPGYSSAYALAAECYSFRRTVNWAPPSALDDEAREGARLARRAVELGGDDPTALWLAACALAHLAQDYDAAVDAADRSLKLCPSSASAYCESGWVRVFRGENEIALDHFSRALRLSPYDPMEWFFHAGMARAYVQARRYEEAVAASRRSIRSNAGWAANYRTLAAALAHLGRMSEAHEAIARVLEIDPACTIAMTTKFLGVTDPVIVGPFIDGLRKAGLPE
jgi:adenylate cyclase